MTAETALILAFVFGSPSPPPQPAVLKYATATKTILSTRAPQGHSHVCPNNNCPIYKQFGTRNVWDHAANAGHACQYCGAAQYVQSRAPVTVLRTVNVVDYEKTPRENWPSSPRPLLLPTAPTATQTMSALSRANYANCPPSG